MISSGVCLLPFMCLHLFISILAYGRITHIEGGPDLGEPRIGDLGDPSSSSRSPLTSYMQHVTMATLESTEGNPMLGSFSGRFHQVCSRLLIVATLFCTLSVGTATVAHSATSNAVTLVSSTITPMPGGGENYSYTLSDGRVMNDPVPPSGFNPLDATAEQLAEYDLPARPTSGSELSAWNTQMSTFKSKSVPTSTRDAFDFLKMSQPEGGGFVTNGTATAPNWGGYNAVGGSPGTNAYVAIKDELKVPSVGYTSSCSSIYGVPIMGSSWIGLGGGTNGSTALIQQGLEWCEGGYMSSSPGWEMFGEALNSSNQNPPGPLCGVSTIQSAGDQLYMNMSYQSSSQTAYFYIDNVTTGVITSCSSGISSSYYDGSTADWINEQVFGNLCINALVNYSSYNFNDAYTELSSSGSWTSLGSQTNAQIYTATTPPTSPQYWDQTPGSIGNDSYGTNDSFSMTWNAWDYSGSLPYC